MTIKTKQILLSIFLVLITVIGLSSVVFMQLKGDYKKLAISLATKSSLNIVKKIEQYFDQNKKLLSSWSSLDIVKDSFEVDDEDGDLQRFIEQINEDYTSILEVICINPNDQIIAGTKTQDLGKKAIYSWFLELKNSEDYINKTQNNDFYLAHKVEVDDSFVGYLVIRLNIQGIPLAQTNSLKSLFTNFQLYQKLDEMENIALVNKNGQNILIDSYQFTEHQEKLFSDIHVSSNFQILETRDHLNNSLLILKISNLPFDMQLLGFIYSKRLYQNINDLLIILMETSLAFILLAILLSLFMGRVISGPINRAKDFVHNIQLGFLDQRLDITTKDEIADMGNALNRMVEDLQNKATMTKLISEGDLTCEINLASKNDYLGNSLNNMVMGLRSLVTSVLDSSSKVNDQSGHILEVSRSLHESAIQQAEDVEDASESMHHLQSNNQLIIDKLTLVSQATKEANESANDGNELLLTLNSSMTSISKAVQDIKTFNKVINNIAFQTNLLALNASVEAARAGQHGKGFSVVANEVRNLAERSTNAAADTEKLIQESIDRVSDGVGVLLKTTQSFSSIMKGIQNVEEVVQDISSSISEQIGDISLASESMKKIFEQTQNCVTLIEDTRSACSLMQSQSQDLQKELLRFHLDDTTRLKLA
ncbi:methyl-accepting chemotaxis protein [bacterium]|nr:methyl-accepting chemotaxis protein [bacterium]